MEEAWLMSTETTTAPFSQGQLMGSPLTNPSIYGRAAQILSEFDVEMPPPPGH